MPLIECVPNVSEGRRRDVVESMARAIRAVNGVRLLDCSSDPSHNRSVFTLVGDRSSVEAAIMALFDRAVAELDLRAHRGAHPRIGVVDVVPFVPLEAATMTDCVALARSVGAAVADRFGVPVYLYGEAATDPARTRLEDIRRGELDGLAARMVSPGWAPDFGPSAPHPSAGASAIGARMPLVAYNVNLDTDRLDVAKAIAAVVRESGGGLPFVKALGIRLEARGIVQVSMNLTNYEATPIQRAFDTVKREARRHGVNVLESEIVGLVPAAALSAAAAHDVQLAGSLRDKVIENKLRDS
jgi:glutamate formiminotransferase / 5-formyltetrahydrofolate cyclo-ligase